MTLKGDVSLKLERNAIFENLGIQNILINYRPDDLGKILVKAVFNDLLYKGWVVKVGVFNNNEIDFVCQRNGETMYVQVAIWLDDQKSIERKLVTC